MGETEVAAPITLLICPHMMKALGLRTGIKRELRLWIGEELRVFKQARVALDGDPCDCEDSGNA